MRNLLLSFLSCFFFFTAVATNYTGVYSFSKGVNKANGTLYVYHFNNDSAFILLQAVSGMPDFFTTEIKGFIRIENQVGILHKKDSCLLEFTLSAGACDLKEISACHFEFDAGARYKKINSKLKKGSSFLPGMDLRKGIVNKDSAVCLSAPHPHAGQLMSLHKDDAVLITDEFNGFYLIELSSRKQDFIWISKRTIVISK